MIYAQSKTLKNGILEIQRLLAVWFVYLKRFRLLLLLWLPVLRSNFLDGKNFHSDGIFSIFFLHGVAASLRIKKVFFFLTS